MTSRDERLAAKKYAGRESASEKAARKAREKEAGKSATQASGGIVDSLRSFRYQAGSGEKIQPVARSADSVERARKHKRRLPGLG